MKYLFTLLMLSVCLSSLAQANNKLYGRWVKVKVTDKEGKELTDDNVLKYGYMRYDFYKKDKMTMALSYSDHGSNYSYIILSNVLEIKNFAGFVMNEFLIEKSTDHELVLLQKSIDGFDSPDCVRYYFNTEYSYQQSIPLTSKNILSVAATDTIFKASAKMYAVYKGDEGFHEVINKDVEKLHAEHPLKSYFLATFIVNNMGGADSLHIVEGLGEEFNKQYIKTFNKLKHNWIPAIYNGKNVAVQMKDEFKYIPSGKYPIFSRYLELGNTSMRQGDFAVAVFNYGKALDSYKTGEVYYKIALCQLLLGNKEQACEAMGKAEDLDYSAATGLMNRFCK